MPKGDNPNSKKNLKKGNRFSKETASENGRKGAEISNARQAAKRSIREWAEILGTMKASSEVLSKLKKIFPNMSDEQAKEMTNNGLMAMRLANEAIIKGNMQAYNLWLDLTGQKAAQKHEVITHQEIDISKVKSLKKLLDD